MHVSILHHVIDGFVQKYRKTTCLSNAALLPRAYQTTAATCQQQRYTCMQLLSQWSCTFDVFVTDSVHHKSKCCICQELTTTKQSADQCSNKVVAEGAGLDTADLQNSLHALQQKFEPIPMHGTDTECVLVCAQDVFGRLSDNLRPKVLIGRASSVL